MRPSLLRRPLLMALKGRRFKEAWFPGLLMSMRPLPLNEPGFMWILWPLPFGREGRREFTKAASLAVKGSVQLGHPRQPGGEQQSCQRSCPGQRGSECKAGLLLALPVAGYSDNPLMRDFRDEGCLWSVGSPLNFLGGARLPSSAF